MRGMVVPCSMLPSMIFCYCWKHQGYNWAFCMYIAKYLSMLSEAHLLVSSFTVWPMFCVVVVQ